MQKSFMSLLLLLFVIAESHSQQQYQAGYIITKSGEKIEGYISDVSRNATKVAYREQQESETEYIDLTQLEEVVVPGEFKYVYTDVEIAKGFIFSVDDMPKSRDPEMIEKEVLLKVLVEGEASLAVFQAKDRSQFYYKLEGEDYRPLVYHEYIVSPGNVAKNQSWKQTLLNNVNCEQSPEYFQQLSYSSGRLKKHFISFNECKNADYIVYKRGTYFNISIKPQAYHAQLKIERPEFAAFKPTETTSFNFSAGVELELVLPAMGYSIALIAEPSFNYFSADFSVQIDNSVGEENVTVDYQSVELPIGVRKYFNISGKRKLFTDINVVLDIPIKNELTFENFEDLTGSQTSPTLAIGAGYLLTENIGVSGRYFFSRNITAQSDFWRTEYQKTSFYIFYKL